MIRLSKCNLTNQEKKAVINIMNAQYLGMGQEVMAFEKKLSNFFGRETVCVVNGTFALMLALDAINIRKEDEVIVPSITYISSFQSISALGATPIPCDIDPFTMTMDINDLKRKISKKTKAIMPVHYAGGVGNLEEIYKIAKNKNLRVIEDAAHAFGTKYKGKLIGNFGDIACFSFDGIKNITSGEGGCVVSNDKKILTKIKNTRLLGVHKDTEKRFANKRSFKFDVKYQGWRCHMSNIMAAIGIVQLSRFNFLSKKRQLLAKKYDSYFRNDKNIYFIEHDYENVVPHIYVIRIYNLKNRELLIKKLKKKGIETGIHYQPNHKLSLYSGNKYYLPNTEKISKEILTLPLHPSLTLKNIDYIVKSLKKLINF